MILGVLKMEIFEKISQLIESNQFSKAKELAQNIPDQVDRINALGMIFFYEGKVDEAINTFKEALKINPTHPDVLFNYSKALFEKKDYFESWRYLTRIPQKNWEVYDMLGDTQLKQNNPAMALHYYKKAYELSNIKELKEKYDSVKKQYFRNEKLAIFCLPGLDNFIKDIAEILSNIYEVKLVVTTDSNQIVQVYNWADIVWLEWANEMAVQITNKLAKENRRIICRLHGYESLRKDLLESVNWNVIDMMIFVADNVQNSAHENMPILRRIPYQMIYNGIDLNKYEFKKHSNGTNLVFVGHFNYKKNPILAIQILKTLCNLNKNYKLFWAGQMQDERIFNYVNYITEKMEIKPNFCFDGFQRDVNHYLEDKNIFLSTSIHEGYGVAILEAMAKGIKPVIHNFYVAEEFYPDEYIFNTIDEAIKMIVSEDYDSEKYRHFVEENCSLEEQIAEVIKAIEITDVRRQAVMKNQVNYDILNINGQEIKVVDPSQTNIIVKLQSYESDLETGLEKVKVPVNLLAPRSLISDKNIEYMIDFLEKVTRQSFPYKKTLYYAFLKDVYEKHLYTKNPDLIIEQFLKLYQSVKSVGRILKPIVTFLNDGLIGVSYHTGQKTHAEIPKDTSLWVVSGRHRVAIANFLSFDLIPTYVVRNRFKSDSGTFSILPTYWKYYLEQNQTRYKKEIESTYVGAFTSDYQLYIDPIKKKIVTDFILKLMPRKVVDVGCNKGEMSYHLIKHGIEVIGIDISPKEALNPPDDYPFIQMNVAEQEIPFTADVIIFLSVYHHLVYNYGLEKADEVFFKLLSKTKYLLFDSGHPQETGIYRQSWVNELRKHFSSERELLDHFSIPYEILGKWKTNQGDERTIVVFINNSPLNRMSNVDPITRST